MLRNIRHFIHSYRKDILLVFWMGMFFQAIPRSPGLCSHTTAHLTRFGMPLPFLDDKFFYRYNDLMEYEIVYGMDSRVWALGINVIAIAVFSIIYVYFFKRLFQLLRLGPRRVTNTTTALFFSALSLLLCIRSWSIPIYYSESATNEVPMLGYHYGFPVKVGTEGTITLLLNYLILIATSTACAIICALIIKKKTHNNPTESTKRAAKVLDKEKQ